MANAWIFQSTQDRLDLTRPLNLRPGESFDWLVTRYRDEMQPADVVYFWMAGDEYIRGIYGRGEILDEAHPNKERVALRVTQRFEEPVLASTLRKDPIFANSLILRQPTGSNFRLSLEEAEAIERALAAVIHSTDADYEAAHPDDLSEQVRAIINRAERIRGQRGAQWIHIEDMLRSLAQQPNSQLSTLLEKANVSLESITWGADHGFSSAVRK